MNLSKAIKAFAGLLFLPVLLFSCGGNQTVDDSQTLLPFRNGVFSGVSVGYLGDIHVEVEVADGRIVRLDVTQHEETPGFAYPTFEIMRAAITFNQNTDVSLVTGATSTSRAFREAVESALVQAGVSLAQLRPGATTAPGIAVAGGVDVAQAPVAVVTLDTSLSAAALLALPVSTANFTPGDFIVTVPGWQEAPMTVQVSFTENQIVGIEILDHNESMYGSGWGFRAMPATQDQILVRQSTQDIDVFTGATITRNAIVNAVEYAIVQAGADPVQLVPQFITEPLPGDRFIPGFIEVNVPANTMDIYGNPLTEGAMRMLYSQYADMNLRLSFGRNEFHLHSGGGFGLGQGNGGHGESVYGAGEIGGGALGGWWFRQVVNHQVNDRQSTQNIDIVTGATMSAAAIIWGVEQGMIAQGANPTQITPITYPRVQIHRNPSGESTDPFFEPSIYTVTVNAWGGPMVVRVTLDRTNVRRIEVLEHNETESFWDMVWGAGADHIMRNGILLAGASGLDDVDLVTGATVSSAALVEAVRLAMEEAWIN
ncbi:MAG: FMN-binding protein [Defluviitaleaceae bacterium]|nr:FMN-binding protein [Defluviitaleaceae bacterium]